MEVFNLEAHKLTSPEASFLNWKFVVRICHLTFRNKKRFKVPINNHSLWGRKQRGKGKKWRIIIYYMPGTVLQYLYHPSSLILITSLGVVLLSPLQWLRLWEVKYLVSKNTQLVIEPRLKLQCVWLPLTRVQNMSRHLTDQAGQCFLPQMLFEHVRQCLVLIHGESLSVHSSTFSFSALWLSCSFI